MIIVEDYEAIRRAFYIEKKSIRQIARMPSRMLCKGELAKKSPLNR